MRPTTYRLLLCAGLAVAAVGCSDSGSGPGTDAQVNLNLATRAAGGAAAASLASVSAPETYTDGAGNTLVLDRVQLVMREIELENETEADACEHTATAGDDACAEVEIGPFLADLPLGTAGATRTVTAEVPAGTYDEVKFKIREPDDDTQADADFAAAHPDLAHASIKVDGTYNGTPFSFVTDLRAEMKLHLSPPLVVGQTAATDLTLFVDLDTWFRDAGGNLVDPGSANTGGANESLVTSNIQQSFQCFEDDDHDGSDDHGGHGGDDGNGGNGGNQGGGADDGAGHV
jgi:hypothetical protein